MRYQKVNLIGTVMTAGGIFIEKLFILVEKSVQADKIKRIVTSDDYHKYKQGNSHENIFDGSKFK